MSMVINLDKQIRVLNGGKYENAYVKSVGLHPNGDTYMTVRFNDFTELTVSDIFGTGCDFWRYAERLCEQCIYDDIEGGDSVPYGLSTVCTPEGHVCNCPDVDLEDPYDELEEGSKCKHFKSDAVYKGISRENFRGMCIENGWCTACSTSQYKRLFKMLEDGTDVKTVALLVSMFSVGVSVEEVLQSIKLLCNK